MALLFRLSDLPELLRTPGGRRQVREGVYFRLWPSLSRLARLHRRTLARNTRVVAVVGTFGKSTTVRAVTAAIAAPVHRSMTRNAWTSIAAAVLRIRPSQRHAVIEAGISGPGQMERYARVVQPDVTVVTSIGSEHHPTMPTLDITRAEKAHMVRALPAAGIAILNGDDVNVMWMKAHAPGRVVTFGFGPQCDVRAEHVRLDWPRGMRFHLIVLGQEREVDIRLIGRQMVYPVLAAIAVASVEGVPLDEALSRLRSLPPTPGRMEPVLLPGGAIILRDEYKGTLETVHAALDVLEDIPAARRIVMFGDMSEIKGREWRHYLRLGMRVGRFASTFVVVGRNFRRYWSGARRTGLARSDMINAGRTVQEAAATLKAMLRPGDVVLFKGRRGQRFDRVRLMLQGRDVKCDIHICELRTVECVDCPMLERGWGKHRPVMPKSNKPGPPVQSR